MTNLKRSSNGRPTRRVLLLLLILIMFGGAAFMSTVNVSANHPVLVEGNCDSPVPGTTIVSPGGTCGDFDGDGRIGTAEDTDGADRIFGTLTAALKAGTGAAAGTGANFNGSILIVRSGRFAESLFIGNTGFIAGEGSDTPGNVTIEAAPGVIADIDAILQGDPAGGNTARTTQAGIHVRYTTDGNIRVVTLRNLILRNWSTGIQVSENSRVNIDNCRIENNISNGIGLFGGGVRTTITNSHVTASGFRTGVGTNVPNPGNGIVVDGGAQARISFTTVSHNAAHGILNTGGASNVVLFKVVTFFNAPGFDIGGAVTIAPNHNHAQ